MQLGAVRCALAQINVTYAFLPLDRVNRVPPPEDEWMRRDAEANAAAAFYYHQQQSADEYVLTDDEVMHICTAIGKEGLGCVILNG